MPRAAAACHNDYLFIFHDLLPRLGTLFVQYMRRLRTNANANAPAAKQRSLKSDYTTKNAAKEALRRKLLTKFVLQSSLKR
jgi:hypothetical protein